MLFKYRKQFFILYIIDQSIHHVDLTTNQRLKYAEISHIRTHNTIRNYGEIVKTGYINNPRETVLS